MKLLIITLFALICLTIANTCSEQKSILEKASQECSSCENKVSCLRTLSSLREINQHCECDSECKIVSSRAYQYLIGCTNVKFLQKRDQQDVEDVEAISKKKKKKKNNGPAPPPPPPPSNTPQPFPTETASATKFFSGSAASTISSVLALVVPFLLILKNFF